MVTVCGEFDQYIAANNTFMLDCDTASSQQVLTWRPVASISWF